jgi:opacity protein-like surface antigen
LGLAELQVQVALDCSGLLMIIQNDRRIQGGRQGKTLGQKNASGRGFDQIAVGMSIMKKVTVCICFLVAPLFAQHFVTNAPPVAAAGPVFEASAGYTYLVLDTPSHQRVGLSGVDANGFVDFNSRWGMMVDSSYARAGNVLGTGHSGNVLSFLIGPAFYPVDFGNTRIFVHTLAGVSLVNSAVPVKGTYYLGGTVTRFSYAVGGGVEHTVAGPLAIRVGADYLRTTFANSTAAMRFQNNLRIVTGFVFRFGNR